MNELVESIREVGMLQPIVVRPLGGAGSSSSWANVGGGLRNRRRWRRSPRSYAKQQITNCSATPLENLHRAS